MKCWLIKFKLTEIEHIHFHPSGNVIPSQQDMNFTKRIQKCGEMMGITVLDHLIIGRKRYFSLREEGMMEEK